MAIVLAVRFARGIRAARQRGTEKARCKNQSRVIREGECAWVYRFIYPAGFILVHR